MFARCGGQSRGGNAKSDLAQTDQAQAGETPPVAMLGQ